MDLRDLGGDVAPPSQLKTRVRDSLRRSGVLHPARRRWLPLAAGIAALALGGGAFMLGRVTGGGVGTDTGSPSGNRYALLLYEDSGFTTSVPEDSLVQEYRAWARDLARRGVTISGEKLGAGDEGREHLGGFFIITAPTDSAARAIANTCPHLRHGGRIALRKIEPT